MALLSYELSVFIDPSHYSTTVMTTNNISNCEVHAFSLAGLQPIKIQEASGLHPANPSKATDRADPVTVMSSKRGEFKRGPVQQIIRHEADSMAGLAGITDTNKDESR